MDRWKLAFDSLPDLILLLDRGGRIERVNRAAETALASPEIPVVVGHTCEEIIHDRLVPARSCPVCRAKHNRQPVEWRGASKYFGAYYHISVIPAPDGASVGGAMLIAREHERRSGEEGDRRRLAGEGLLRALDSLEIGVHVVDIKTHEILWANDIKKRQFGRDIVGKRCHDAFQETGRPCPHCDHDTLVREGEIQPGRSWVQKDKFAGDWCLFADKAFVWPDGRMAKIEIVADIYDSSFPDGKEE